MSITVGYWSIRGLGAPLRMMVMYSGEELQAECYDLVPSYEDGKISYSGASWFSTKPALKAENPLINLPYVKDGDIIVSQTNACFSYIGRKLGLWGDTPLEVIMCEEVLCEIMDLRNKMIPFAYGGGDDLTSKAQTLLTDVIGSNGVLQKLELVLARNEAASNGTFLVTAHATAPDFHLWEMLEQYTALASFFELSSPLESFPLLSAFRVKFGALPANAKYLSSPLSKLPFNNKMAAFGATPSMAPWTCGQEYDFGSLSGTY